MTRYRVTLTGLPGRIGPVTYTCTVETDRPTTVLRLAEHRAGVTELDYSAAHAVRLEEIPR